MSPVRTVIAVLLVSLLVGIFAFSPVSSLVAQETSATPTAIPYEDLPQCPPLVPDSLLPTPEPDLSPNAPRCRGPVVYATATPLPTAPPPPPTLTATPDVAEEISSGPESSDVPNQTNKLYLPMMQGDSEDESANIGGEVDDTVEPYPGYIPFEQLPICPEIPPVDSSKLPPPDDSPPTCRVQSTLIVDVRELIEQGIDPASVGISGDRPPSESDSVQTSGVAIPDASDDEKPEGSRCMKGITVSLVQ